MGSCFALGVGIRAFLHMIFDPKGHGVEAIFCLGDFFKKFPPPQKSAQGGGGRVLTAGID